MKRLLRSLGIAILGLAVALTFVRLSLDWSDSRPYEGKTTEQRYIVFMAIAVAIFLGGVVGAVCYYRRVGKRKKSSAGSSI